MAVRPIILDGNGTMTLMSHQARDWPAKGATPSLSKVVYDLGAKMRQLQNELEHDRYAGHTVARDQIEKMTQSARDLAGYLLGHHEQ